MDSMSSRNYRAVILVRQDNATEASVAAFFISANASNGMRG
jgi:hypothetical protein